MFLYSTLSKEIRDLETLVKQFLPKVEIEGYREAMFENNLSWGVSAICRYLNVTAGQRDIPLTKDLDYLPTFVKYGANSKVACQLIRSGIPRTDAISISNTYKEKLQKAEVNDEETQKFEDDFTEMLNALNILNGKELKNLKIKHNCFTKWSDNSIQNSKQCVKKNIFLQ